MSKTNYMKREQVAQMIHSKIATADPDDGPTKKEICKALGIRPSQFDNGYELLKETMDARGTPINVTHRHPYRYSIPRPVNGAETIDHNMWRQAIIARTSLRRLLIHTTAGKDYHPNHTAELELLAGAANRAIKTINRVLAQLGVDDEDADE